MSDSLPPQPPQYAPPPQPQYAPTAPPQYAPPQYAPPAQPQYAPPAQQYGPAPKPKGNKGCLIAVVVVMVIMVGGIAAAAYGIHYIGNKAVDAIGTVTPCPYLSDADASAALGPNTQAQKFTGLGKVLNITDDRVLAEQESCILQKNDSSGATANANATSNDAGLGRTVKYEGGDAASRYQRELTKAKGETVKKDGSLTVESMAYFNKDVPDLGDEAFCTTAGIAGLAGVLTRQGTTLVYVSLALNIGQAPGIDLSDGNNPKLGTDDPACDKAQVLARTILG